MEFDQIAFVTWPSKNVQLQICQTLKDDNQLIILTPHGMLGYVRLSFTNTRVFCFCFFLINVSLYFTDR